jgi:hypothetical protein
MKANLHGLVSERLMLDVRSFSGTLNETFLVAGIDLCSLQSSKDGLRRYPYCGVPIFLVLLGINFNLLLYLSLEVISSSGSPEAAFIHFNQVLERKHQTFRDVLEKKIIKMICSVVRSSFSSHCFALIYKYRLQILE